MGYKKYVRKNMKDLMIVYRGLTKERKLNNFQQALFEPFTVFYNEKMIYSRSYHLQTVYFLSTLFTLFINLILPSLLRKIN